MTDGNTLIVDVIQKGDDYILNDTPINMMIAYEVVRRHVTDNGTFYSQLTKKHKTSEGYTFVFDTGDTFTCASDTGYPTSATLNDVKPAELPAVTGSDEGKVLTVNNSGVWVAQTPASGGGVLVVHNVNGTLDKTWQEIHDAFPNVYIDMDGTMCTILKIYADRGEYGVVMDDSPGATSIFVASSASGYPAAQ